MASVPACPSVCKGATYLIALLSNPFVEVGLLLVAALPQSEWCAMGVLTDLGLLQLRLWTKYKYSWLYCHAAPFFSDVSQAVIRRRPVCPQIAG